MGKRFFSVVMAVWFASAAIAGAALSVCRMPCCEPTAHGTNLSQAHHTANGECAGHSMDDEDAAALFFAEETGGPTQFLRPAAADAALLHDCMAQLESGKTYVQPKADDDFSGAGHFQTATLCFAEYSWPDSRRPPAVEAALDPSGPPGTHLTILHSRLTC